MASLGLSTAAGMLWGLADPFELPLEKLGNLTATAILGWYAWHTASRTIPDLIRHFRSELAAERAECRSDREALRKEMAEERWQRHADNLAIVEALHELARGVGEGNARRARSGN